MIRRRTTIVAALALVIGCLTAAGGISTAHAAVSSSPDHVVVYSNNIENRITCTGNNWNRLISYMKTQPQYPDIITVQQVSNSSDLEQLVTQLSNEFPGTYSYAGQIAVADPGSMGYDGACSRQKNQQTNAVIYRTDRFLVEERRTWRSDAPEGGTGHDCVNLHTDRNGNSQDRVVNVGVRLYDRVADKDMTVASFHWPTNTHGGPNCADENFREADTAVDNLGGSLRIVAGDANTTVGSRGWWNNAKGAGYIDAVADTYCPSDCPGAHDTLGSRRIDYLLAEHSAGVSNVQTITATMTGGAYSDHRAITAYVEY